MIKIVKLLEKTVWIVAGFAIFVMSLSLKVQHFEAGKLLVSHADFDPEAIPQNWVDYFAHELAETGEDLPGKNLQPRSNTDYCKKNQHECYDVFYDYTIKAYSNFTFNTPIYFLSFRLIPIPSYYTILSLFYVF